jgi:hypothetical protein
VIDRRCRHDLRRCRQIENQQQQQRQAKRRDQREVPPREEKGGARYQEDEATDIERAMIVVEHAERQIELATPWAEADRAQSIVRAGQKKCRRRGEGKAGDAKARQGHPPPQRPTAQKPA